MAQLPPRARWYHIDTNQHFAEWVAEQRDKGKREYASARYWANGGSHLVGVKGELCYSWLTGQAIDLSVDPRGDNGADFPDGCDVKTSTFLSDPILKVPVGTTKWPRFFALAVVDEKTNRGCIAGFATPDMVRAGRVRDFGHGKQYTLSVAELKPPKRNDLWDANAALGLTEEDRP